MAKKGKEPTFDDTSQCSQLQGSSSEENNGDREDWGLSYSSSAKRMQGNLLFLPTVKFLI